MRDMLAPTGKLIQGHVQDVNKGVLERMLKGYDKQLYLKWNPKKRSGWGMWEIRRTPNDKMKVYQGDFNGWKICTYEDVEIDLVHHVLDLEHLNYECLGKLKKMDTWNDKYFVHNLEYNERTQKAELDKKAQEELKYHISQHKQEWRDFAQLVASGMNPGKVLSGKW